MTNNSEIEKLMLKLVYLSTREHEYKPSQHVSQLSQTELLWGFRNACKLIEEVISLLPEKQKDGLDFSDTLLEVSKILRWVVNG